MKSNEVTQNSNTVLQRLTAEEFRAMGKRINRQGQDFCYIDFPMRKGAFRQRIFRIRDEIVCTTGGTPCFYRFKDIPTGPEKRSVTLEGMWVGKKFEEFLRDAQIQHPQIHDIKLKFESITLHSFLKSRKWKVDPTNQRISLNEITLGKRQFAKVSIYPKTVQIDIGCSVEPLVYDIRGTFQLLQFLERIRYNLLYHTNFALEDIPDPREWIITNYHMNKDGSREYSGKKFNVTVENFSGGLIRCYAKNFPNGSTKIRIEQIQSPKCSVNEEINKMITADIHAN